MINDNYQDVNKIIGSITIIVVLIIVITIVGNRLVLVS